MLCLINKYTSRHPEDKQQQQQHNSSKEMVDIAISNEPPPSCVAACCPATFLLSATTNTDPHSTTTTTRAARSDFSKSTTSSFFPDTHFTSHESLPSLPAAFSDFSAAYPKYADTHQADLIRHQHYPHLSHHVCLDYSGFSLFSHAQPPPSSSFDISYSSTSFDSQVKYGCQGTAIEASIKRRIMEFMNMSPDDYSFICTANRTSTFRLLAESYPFRSHRRLLTVYDYESEAVTAMSDSARKKGANAMSASFSWPSLRIKSDKLKKMLSTGSKKRRGLFVFPLQSRMTGARYPYLWMNMARENGWHVVLDAGALGPKDMDSLGLSLIQPDFIVCSFYKVFGEDPSGFAGLFVKKTSGAVLESSTVAASIGGVVSIVAARSMSRNPDSFSGTGTDLEAQSNMFQSEQDDVEIERSFSGPILCNGSVHDRSEEGQSSSNQNEINIEVTGETSAEILELDNNIPAGTRMATNDAEECLQIECRSLDHADLIGLLRISCRLRYITNWLVIALLKLQHPHSENGRPLVRIYGPRIKFDRAPALAFNVFDWKGERVEPALVQKLADRSNISLSCGFLQNIWFSEKYTQQRDELLEARNAHMKVDNRRKEISNLGISVVNASLGFLTNFDDAYSLWVFVAKFLDADFVEKERWRYIALNQRMVEL